MADIINNKIPIIHDYNNEVTAEKVMLPFAVVSERIASLEKRLSVLEGQKGRTNAD